MASRKIHDLQEDMAHLALMFKEECRKDGLDILIYCTKRSFEEQAILYRQSRPFNTIVRKANQLRTEYGRDDLADILLGVGPQHGPHVTNAAPGESLHNWGYAFDGVPLVGGKPVWGTEEPWEKDRWRRYGKHATNVGLIWAGNWTAFKEYPHVQMPIVDWRELIRQ